jgi:lipopolysaccharide/colanic/teichoic acid biosynthesis glycosyltransferase/O-antigen/teichoic acid export membrane protein
VTGTGHRYQRQMSTTEQPEPASHPQEGSNRDSPVTYAYLRSDGTAYVVWGSAIAGVAAYAYQLLGGRVLGAERFAPVSVLLTIHFLTFIVVMLPIEQLAVRRLTIDPGRSRLPAAAWWLAGATALGATVVALGGVDRFLNGDYRFVGFTLLTVVVHFVFANARGHLAGWRRFREYGLASGAASLLRLAAAIAVTLVRPSASAFALALIVGPLIVFVWRPFRRPPDVPAAPTGAEGGPSLLGGLVLAAAASQALLLAGPLLVGMLGGSAVEVSIAFACFTVGRAPLVFGYNLLARVLGPFTRMALRGERRELSSWARGMALSGLALAGLATLAGWLAGPWVVRVAFGPEFVVDGTTTALIAAGVVLAGAGLFVGQILVAEARTGRLAMAWSAGLVAAVATLAVLAGMAPITLVATAFLIGEAAALAALVAGAVPGGEERRPIGVVAYEVSKRTVDIAVSLTLLVVLAPLLIVAGVLVRFDSPGPIFFRQLRVGRDSRGFRLVKIRTMEADADEAVFAEHLARLEAAKRDGRDIAIGIAADDRTTRVGRVLRRWSIDELPNLWNVARGSMSLVGPRPLVPEEADLVGPDHVRFTVKPGMTGLAQVNGRDTISLAERTRFDEEYVAKRSMGTDLRILVATLGSIRAPGG